VILTDTHGSRAIEIDTASGRSTGLIGVSAAMRPVVEGSGATVGLEVAADEVVLASAGSDPVAFRPDAAAQEALP
jgi:hypothetical protein